MKEKDKDTPKQTPKDELERKEEISNESPDSKSVQVVKTGMLAKALKQAEPKLPSNNNLIETFNEQSLTMANNMVKSGLLPDGVKNAQAALIIMQKGKELGFSPMTSFEHIVVINGKPSLDGAALGTLLRKGGVEWEVIHNAEKKYKGEGVNKKLVDVITEIKFYRASMLDKEKILTHTSIFTFKDAQLAGLTDKDVWKKYLKSMLFWRCLSLGARQFAPDLTTGMLTAEEADNSGDIWLDEHGNIMKIK